VSKKKQVIVSLIANTEQFTKKMDMAARKWQAVGKKIEAEGRRLTMQLTAPIVAMGALAVKAFAEQEQAIAKMQAAIRANGKDVATVTADYRKFASELQKVTVVGDETTLALLQLAETMQAADPKQAVEGAIALSRALGVDLESATKMAVQAQQGQFTMLQRYVPALRSANSDTEKAAMVQKLYADGMELAKAETETTTGRLLQMKNAMGDLAEEFGGILADYITPFIKRLKELADRFQGLTDRQKKNIVNWGLMAAAIGPVLWISGKLVSTVGLLMGRLSAMGAGLQVVYAKLGLYKIATDGATKATIKLNAAQKANLIVLGLTAVAFAAMKVYQAY